MVNLENIINNIVALIPVYQPLLNAIFFFLGAVFIYKGIMTVNKRVEDGHRGGSYWGHIMNVVAGILFVSMPGFISSVGFTLFGAVQPSADKIFEYAESTVSLFEKGTASAAMLTGLVTIIQFIGIIAFARGVLLLNAAAQGTERSRTYGNGITFIIAGAMCVNFPFFVGALELLVTTTTS